MKLPSVFPVLPSVLICVLLCCEKVVRSQLVLHVQNPQTSSGVLLRLTLPAYPYLDGCTAREDQVGHAGHLTTYDYAVFVEDACLLWEESRLSNLHSSTRDLNLTFVVLAVYECPVIQLMKVAASAGAAALITLPTSGFEELGFAFRHRSFEVQSTPAGQSDNNTGSVTVCLPTFAVSYRTSSRIRQTIDNYLSSAPSSSQVSSSPLFPSVGSYEYFLQQESVAASVNNNGTLGLSARRQLVQLGAAAWPFESLSYICTVVALQLLNVCLFLCLLRYLLMSSDIVFETSPALSSASTTAARERRVRVRHQPAATRAVADDSVSPPDLTVPPDITFVDGGGAIVTTPSLVGLAEPEGSLRYTEEVLMDSLSSLSSLQSTVTSDNNLSAPASPQTSFPTLPALDTMDGVDCIPQQQNPHDIPPVDTAMTVVDLSLGDGPSQSKEASRLHFFRACTRFLHPGPELCSLLRSMFCQLDSNWIFCCCQSVASRHKNNHNVLVLKDSSSRMKKVWLTGELITCIVRASVLIEPLPFGWGIHSHFTLVFVQSFVFLSNFVLSTFLGAYVFFIVRRHSKLALLTTHNTRRVLYTTLAFVTLFGIVYLLQAVLRGLSFRVSALEQTNDMLLSIVFVWLSVVYATTAIELRYNKKVKQHSTQQHKFYCLLNSAFGISLIVFGFLMMSTVSIDDSPRNVPLKFLFVWLGSIWTGVSNFLFFAIPLSPPVSSVKHNKKARETRKSQPRRHTVV